MSLRIAPEVLETRTGPTRTDGPVQVAPQGPNGRVAQGAVFRIQDLILKGALAPGAALPSQRALAQQLGVSRASLREALSILATLGMVRIEPARGTFVSGEADGAGAEGSPVWRFGSSYAPWEVYQFRKIAEAEAASLAAMRVTAAEVDRLRAILSVFREATRAADLLSSSQSDFDLHQAITQMSGNRMLADLHRTYHHVLLESQRLPLARRSRLWEPVVEHERIVQAIAMNDPDGAAYYMRAHIDRAADRVGIRLPGVV
jgi:GntR family transcriptional repressor for pyruvate dehydrogenase complex